MKKIKILFAIFVVILLMLVLATCVQAVETETSVTEEVTETSEITDTTNWGYEVIKIGKEGYKLLFTNTNFKEGHEYYIYVDKNENILDAEPFFKDEVANGLTANFVNSVKATKILEDGVIVDPIKDNQGNNVKSLDDLVNNYSFFIIEGYTKDGVSHGCSHGKKNFQASFNSQNNYTNINNMKYDLVRRLGKSTIESQNYWKNEYYDMILSNVTLNNAESTYFVWVDKNDGEFFNKDEKFLITAALVNDIRLKPFRENGVSTFFLATDDENFGVDFPKDIEDLVNNYSFQIIEEKKIPGTTFEAAKVIYDKTSLKESTSFQNWTDASELTYELVKNNQDDYYEFKVSNIEFKNGHNYYAWILPISTEGEYSEKLPENVNLSFPLSDYAYLYDINNEEKTTSGLHTLDSRVDDLSKIYGKYCFQIFEEYMPEGAHVSVSRVIYNTTVIEEPKKEPVEEPKDEPIEKPEDDKKDDIYTYKVTSGENQTYKNKDLTVKFDAPVDELVEVSINGNKLDKEYYTATEGSTVLTVSKTYLKTLQSGTYTLVAKYENEKTAETTFVVENEKDGTEADEVLPQTGLFTTVTCVALVVLVGVVYVFYNRYKRIVIK